MLEAAPLDGLIQSFLNEFNHTGSGDKLLDVKNHNAFKQLMRDFYTEIYKSIGRDNSKIEQIATNLLKVFEISPDEILLSRALDEIFEDIMKNIISRSVSITVAVQKLREWRESPIV